MEGKRITIKFSPELLREIEELRDKAERERGYKPSFQQIVTEALHIALKTIHGQ